MSGKSRESWYERETRPKYKPEDYKFPTIEGPKYTDFEKPTNRDVRREEFRKALLQSDYKV